MTPNPVCARQVAHLLWLQPEAYQCEDLCRILRAIGRRYGPELAAAFADLVVAELNALVHGEVH
jgi:hypothetical protein